MLRHFLAALAYRTQKALRDAPEAFGEFRAGHDVRTPAALVRHMTSVLGYARTFFVGGEYRPEPLPNLAAEIGRFHEMLADVAAHLARGTELRGVRPEQLLQGPFADAMTHAGQLAMLRRLAGAPVPPENFIHAEITPNRLGPDQPSPAQPDRVWPEAPCNWVSPYPRGLSTVEEDGLTVVEGRLDEVIIAAARDAARIVEACLSARTRRVLLYPCNLPAAFFDLSSGEAGEILQKLQSYHIRFAVVCPPNTVRFSSRFHEALGREFQVFETRRAAREWLASAR